jgi:peptidyl-prolyl cis-trans isomerase SurA
MGKKLSTLICSVPFLALAFSASAAEIIDRMVATVNGHIILQSDWEDSLRYEAFSSGRPLDHLTADDRKSALDRLIDQELLREQLRASDSPHSSPEDVAKRTAEIRKQYPNAESEQGWQMVLDSYGLTEEGLKSRVGVELDLMRLVDARLRPAVTIDSKSIESYYNQELLPQLSKSGGEQLPLAQVTPKIKELLTQKKMDELLTAWLQNLRAGSEIHAEATPAEAGSAAR